MVDYSGLLFARPSFLGGVARVLDLGGTLNEYNRLPTPEDADVVALRSDWEAISQDFRSALSTVADDVQASTDRGAQATG